MPVYVFKCRLCDHSHDAVRSIGGRDEPLPCPKCSDGVCERDVVASMRVNSTDMEYASPVYSNALGVPPNQIAEAQRKFPHHEFDPNGRMILRSHAGRNRVLRDLGYFDKDSFY